MAWAWAWAWPIQEATLELIRWFIPLLHRLPRLHPAEAAPPTCAAGMPIRPTAIPGACGAGCSWASPMQRIYPENGWAAQLLRGGSWNNNPRNCRLAYRNHNQPDNANANTIPGFRVVCLPQHPSPSEPPEGIPAGAPEGSKTRGSKTRGSQTRRPQTRGSRPAPVIGDPGIPGLPRACRRLIRTVPGGAPPAPGLAIGSGSALTFSPQP